MFDIHRFFLNLFDDKNISNDELETFSVAHLAAMLASNGSGALSTIIAQTATLLTTLGNTLGNETVKLGVQKARVAAKENYRAALPNEISAIYGIALNKYKKGGAKMHEIFPEGLSVFSDCDDASLEDKLEALRDAVSANVADLGSGNLLLAEGLVTAWTSIYGQSTTGKAAKNSAADTRRLANKALRTQLYVNLHTCALAFPGDVEKAKMLFPQHLLEDHPAQGEEGETPEPTP